MEKIEIDFDQDGFADAKYVQEVIPLGTTSVATSYSVGYAFVALERNSLLLSSSGGLDYLAGRSVTSINQPYVQDGGTSGFGLTSYQLKSSINGGFHNCFLNSSIPTWNSRTEGIFGFRFQGDDGVHHGWVRFTRPDTETATVFQIAGYDWNPTPGAPIGAGEPPPPPPLQTQFTDEGLHLLWDARFSGLVLEWADRLSPPVEWHPVEGVEGSAVLLPLEAAGRFYRLRRP